MRTWKEGEKRFTDYLSTKLWPAIRRSKGLRGEGVEDIEWGPLSVELKTRKIISQYLFEWLFQAEKNRDNRIPIVLIHKDNTRVKSAIVVMGLEWFIKLLTEISPKGESNDNS